MRSFFPSKVCACRKINGERENDGDNSNSDNDNNNGDDNDNDSDDDNKNNLITFLILGEVGGR